MKPVRETKSVAAAATLLALLLGAGGATVARAEEGGPAPQKIEKKRVVIINKDGEEQVFDGDGPGVKRGYLGVALTDLTPELRTHFGAPDSAGVMVSKVEAGSPAEKGGLRVGDILAALDGAALETSWDLRMKVRNLKDGAKVPIELRRDGKAQTISVIAEEKARQELDLAPFVFKGGKSGEPLVLRLGDGELPLPMGNAFYMRDDGEGGPAQKRVIVHKGPGTPREAELEKKLKDLEKRLNDLEKQLAKKP